MVTSHDGVKFQREIVGSHIVPVPREPGDGHALGVRSAETIIKMEKFHTFVFSTAPQKPISAEFGTGGIQQWRRNDPNVALDRKYAGRPIRVFHRA
jgi:hypothetical protein